MCVLYVSFGSKVRRRTFGCVTMGSAALFILRSRLLVYYAGAGCMYYFAVLVLAFVDVMEMSSAWAMT